MQIKATDRKIDRLKKRILEVKERRKALRNKLERETAARLEKVKKKTARIARL
ncbi:hypothetical protein K432DRAFT_412099 [Lepidopterella palustris CBS 459.81]|uniref:Uncharacterized protein n=1 Tax=Lepidopterella palustris CBS 459.81 TaxID=1314670 RepID=A0A8E2DVT5_9PEZI|nr:hypothetical protein K432DRAFT_412099 [Lepidopterella palustris CBS 459.81]